jgi:hypothetical protein
MNQLFKKKANATEWSPGNQNILNRLYQYFGDMIRDFDLPANEKSKNRLDTSLKGREEEVIIQK